MTCRANIRAHTKVSASPIPSDSPLNAMSPRPTVDIVTATHTIVGTRCRNSNPVRIGTKTTKSPVMKPDAVALVCRKPISCTMYPADSAQPSQQPWTKCSRGALISQCGRNATIKKVAKPKRQVCKLMTLMCSSACWFRTNVKPHTMVTPSNNAVAKVAERFFVIPRSLGVTTRGSFFKELLRSAH